MPFDLNFLLYGGKNPFNEGKLISPDASGSTGSGGGVAGPKTGERTSTSTQTSQGGNYFEMPGVAHNVIGSTGNLVTDAANQYQGLISDPYSNPIVQNAMSGFLASRLPQEQLARRNLADVFRAAGNTASSTYAKAAMGQETGFARDRTSGMSDIVAKLYPSIAQASFAPIGQADSLLGAQKMSQQTANANSNDQSTSWGFPPQPGGGGGSSGSGQTVGGGLFNMPSGNAMISGPQYTRSSPNSSFAGPSANYAVPDSPGSNFTGGGSGDGMTAADQGGGTYDMGDQSWGSFANDPSGNANWW